MSNYNSVQDFYNVVAKSRMLDKSFARKDDKDLTAEEIAAINEYWGKYSFAYPEIDYESFKTFKNRCGRFDVRHIPGAIRTQYLNNQFVNENYKVALQNKALLPTLFPNVKQPELIVCTMAGYVYGKNYKPITKKAALDLMAKELKNGYTLVLKTNGSVAGNDMEFFDPDHDASAETLSPIMDKYWDKTVVVQRYVYQSEFTEKFYPGSVNTLRVTSLLFKGNVHILAAYLRVGKYGGRTDIFSQGGCIIGVDLKGKCNKWALNGKNERITTLENGFDLNKLLIVPNFEKVKTLVREMHYRIPYVRMVSWDFAFDAKNEPVFIDNNFAASIQLHEAVTGPIFGKLTDSVLDTYLLKKFSIPVKYNNWEVSEFADHVYITGYTGTSGAQIPETLNGKPVTGVSAAAKKAAENAKKNSGIGLFRKK